MALAKLIWSGYGHDFLQMLSSWYPGFNAARNVGEIIIVTLYAIVDGLIGGVIFGCIYNTVAKSSSQVATRRTTVQAETMEWIGM